MQFLTVAWWARKGFHLLLAGLVAALFLAASATSRPWPIIVLFCFGLILVAVDLGRPWIRWRLMRQVFARERHHRVGCLTYGVAGGVVSWLIAGPAVAALAMILLAIVDGAAAIFGRSVGVTPLPGRPDKTWEGSVGGFVAGLLVMYVWPGAQPSTVLVVLAVSVAEALSDGLHDNFTAPMAAAMVATLLR